MSASVQDLKEPEPGAPAAPRPETAEHAPRQFAKRRWVAPIAVPVAAVLALGIHLGVSGTEPALETHSYTQLLAVVLGAFLLTAVVQPFSRPLRHWLREMGPIIAAAVVLLGLWEVITSGLRWLPL